MATWEDGPEYAPLEAPERFTVPDVPPLGEAPPPAALPYAPAERPQFGNPDDPVAPLATLDPERSTEERDPSTPFEVDSGTMTEGNSGGAWGAAHWRPPSGPPVGQPGPWGPPAGVPIDPAAPVALQSGAPHPVGNMPAPGTPGWFGPGPNSPAPQRPPSLWRATPPGAIIALALSIIVVVSPLTFVAGLLLSLRARYAKRAILIGYAVVGAVILMITVGSTLANYGSFGDWFRTAQGWCVLGSALMIVLTLVLVNNELKRGPQGGAPTGGYPPRPPYSS
ncbi:hypothetical protein [Microlunatus soli]|nr:hypothetical protein [Microlunatus soli]